jgi:tetratricopeptide (TPR) repeat protein
MDPRGQNKALAMIAGASLLVLLGMGFYYYQYIGNQPDIVIPPAPIAQQVVETQLLEDPNNVAQQSEAVPSAFESHAKTQEVEKLEAQINPPAKKMPDNLVLADNEAIEEASNQAEVIEDVIPVKTSKNTGKSKKLQFGESIASESASINVSKSNPQSGVNPTLMSAYEAYNAGNDAEAQKLYKQVLQRDVRNVDALLGLGAISSRQDRVLDANGWYSKVLEIEPRNSLAQSALLDSQLQANQSQGNTQGTESRLKNMLVKHPDDANLHVALGNLYAEQNQWASAQQAYFDAYSLNASADNAFNLAVSLDQMGKPKLALPYYQRALEQASSTSNIDKVALEARIAAIQ